MYNLNVNLAAGAANGNLLGIENSCTTPKTPEILNSLIAMSNPFDGFNANRNSNMNGPRVASCPPNSNDSSSSSSGSPLNSPTGSTSPPSVQHTCSQLIKEGLKLTIQTKRRNTGHPLDLASEYTPTNKMAKKEEVSHNYGDDYDDPFSPGIGLTAEDEERRRRRRERNKIAATKCRLKKRERTVNLVQESEVLETQNHDLKNQIQDLESERRKLVDMLNMHTPTCVKNGRTRNHSGTLMQQHQSYNTHVMSPDGSSYSILEPYSYSSMSCNFNSNYAPSGMDSGCMA